MPSVTKSTASNRVPCYCVECNTCHCQAKPTCEYTCSGWHYDDPAREVSYAGQLGDMDAAHDAKEAA